MSKTGIMILPYSTFDTWQCMCAFTILMCVSWLSWVLSNRTRRTTTRSPIPLISSWFNFGPTPRPLSGKYHVGMRSEVTADGDPLRLFYPIADNAQRTHKHDAPWLNINLAHYLKALGTIELKKGGDFSPPGPRASQIKITLAEILLGLIGYLAPANGLVLPATLDAEPLKNSEDFPLIVFSHGFLGTGAENGLMCVEWASHGFRVAAVHHTDGSAPLAYRPDGTRVPFALCPQTNPDKIEFRRIQVKMRSQQLCRVVLHLCAQPNARADVALAGFSYGASTSFLAARELGCLATCAPIRVRCVLALDGWYFTGAAFPPDVFGDAGDVGEIMHLPPPSLKQKVPEFKNSVRTRNMLVKTLTVTPDYEYGTEFFFCYIFAYTFYAIWRFSKNRSTCDVSSFVGYRVWVVHCKT
eukprot:GEMP01064149.1.p1 GENE.GEMP01064149.1~~GEMP01064149.1.p1  ORF type:complete len:412 (+),score=73.48 GEMP01064149.1:71-1306(+)